MKRNENFTLITIAQIPYILPYGQMIADLKRGIRTNETGSLLWELLKNDLTEEELTDSLAAHFASPASERGALLQDVRDFLAKLSSFGMLSDELSPSDENFYGLYEFGGLRIKLYGASDSFSRNFKPFRVQGKNALLALPHMTVTVKTENVPQHTNGRLLLRNQDLSIVEASDRYLFLFPSYPNIPEAYITKDGTRAVFFCTAPVDQRFREDLFHAIRNAFLYRAWLSDCLVIHSASILYRDRVWLFSGHSGMGKSTHTNLWRFNYGTPVVNGDLNLFTVENKKAVVRGIPWCGTSGICDKNTYPLGGIILLNQAPFDAVEELSEDEKRLLVSQRLISPTWHAAMLKKNLKLVDKIAKKVLICRLKCTKEISAAKTMKKYIDEYLKM